MFSLVMSYQGFDALEASLGELQSRLFDLRPLASVCAEIMRHQNRVTRPAGLDQHGDPFVQLAESTWKKRVRQGRFGPPLSPDGPASPITTAFSVEEDVRAPDDITVRGAWDSLPWVHFHVDDGSARGHLPVRDPAGIPPWAFAQVMDAFEAFVSETLSAF
jgi:hypothetical protein